MRGWLLGAVAAAVIVVGCGLGGAGAQPQGEKIALRYAWEVGKTLTYRLTQGSDSSTTMPGEAGEQKIKQTQVMRVRLKPREVSDAGVATVEATIDAVGLNVEGPVTIVYDSDDPAASTDHPAAKMMAALVGTNFEFTVTPAGDVDNVTGMDAVIGKLAGAAGAPEMAENMRRQLGDEAVGGMLEQCFRVLPEKPASIGEAWKTSLEVPLPVGRARTETTLTLASVDPAAGRKAARITAESLMTLLEGGAPAGLPPGMTIKMDEAKGQGFALFDVEGGFLRAFEMTQTMPITVTAAGMGEGGADLEVHQSVKATSKMELVQDAGAAQPDKGGHKPAKE